jgi:hypothetical protein
MSTDELHERIYAPYGLWRLLPLPWANSTIPPLFGGRARSPSSATPSTVIRTACCAAGCGRSSDRPGLPPRSSCATGVLLAFPGLPRDRPPLPAIVVTCRPFGVASVVARACHAPIEVKYGSEVVAQGEDDLPGQDHDRGRPHLGEALHERGEPDESAPNAAQPGFPSL